MATDRPIIRDAPHQTRPVGRWIVVRYAVDAAHEEPWPRTVYGAVRSWPTHHAAAQAAHEYQRTTTRYSYLARFVPPQEGDQCPDCDDAPCTCDVRLDAAHDRDHPEEEDTDEHDTADPDD